MLGGLAGEVRGVDQLTQENDRWRALVNAVMKLRVSATELGSWFSTLVYQPGMNSRRSVGGCSSET
jgi:hypothetical protein